MTEQSNDPRAWKIIVTMPDGSRWEVPVSIIAANRARYYADRDRVTYDKSMEEDTLPLFLADPDEVLDWAENNMNWADVRAFARQLPRSDVERDYQEGWVNGEKEIVK